ncbi:MAG: ParA family protein [bacterium]|nr:ParA family protein [bacterium]
MDDPRFEPADNDAPVSPLPELLPRRRTPWNSVGGRVISVVSRKGGVGKTTSTVNLGAALALSGHSVLIVGLDPQCGVCRTLGVRPHELPRCLDELWSARARLADLAQSSPVENLFFVAPRILTLEEEERFLGHLQERGGDLVREIDRARSLYDTILLDCPPGLGAPTRAALLASDGYLVPVQNEELCRESLDALLEFIDTFRDRNFASDLSDGEHAAPLQLEGLFLTMAAQGTRVGREVAARIQEDFGDLLFDTAIPRTVRLAEMALKGQPAVIYDRRSAGSRAYFDLADELVARYCVDRAAGNGGEAVDAGDGGESGPGDRPAARFAAGGLERFLAALAGGSGDAAADRGIGEPGFGDRDAGEFPLDTFGGPEMVSLDDLLDEEERRNGLDERSSGDDWGGEDWSFDSDRLN